MPEREKRARAGRRAEQEEEEEEEEEGCKGSCSQPLHVDWLG
jgi:hypothetical protein